MHNIKSTGILIIFIGLCAVGCRGAEEIGTSSPTAIEIVGTSTITATYNPYVAPVYTPPVETVSSPYPYPGPGSGILQPPVSPAATGSYPGPQVSPVAPTLQGFTPTIIGPGVYPGPATSQPTSQGSPQATPTQISGGISEATIPAGIGTTPTTTARISKPLGTPPPPPATISIWHSWRDEQLAVLEFVIQAFQDQFPDVYFYVTYIPFDELYEGYRQAAYNGAGPSILIGPVEWGPPLFDDDLVVDLYPYTRPEFLSTINLPALETGIYQNALIGLPYAQRGILLIRNQSIINQPPQTFEDLVNLSVSATRGSNIGAYIERGSFFSSAHLEGLGGNLMDVNYDPSFNNQYGLAWMDLLGEFERLGPTGFNTDNDVGQFKEGKVGFIIDGSWNLAAIAEEIGEEVLTVDPWPTYRDIKLTGFVQTDALFLNTNIHGNEQFAALRFMGYLLDKEVQGTLAEAGFIPSVIDAQPQNGVIRAAMTAFQGGTAYPVVPSSDYLRPYWVALDAAIEDVFERGIDPEVALQVAHEYILERLMEIRNEP